MKDFIDIINYKDEDMRNVISSIFHMLKNNDCLMKKVRFFQTKDMEKDDVIKAVKRFRKIFIEYSDTHKLKIGKYTYLVSNLTKKYNEECIMLHLCIYHYVEYLISQDFPDKSTYNCSSPIFKNLLDSLLIGKAYDEIQKDFEKLLENNKRSFIK